MSFTSHAAGARLAHLSLAVLATVAATAASAQIQRGPNPTIASLEAPAGTYAVATATVPAPSGYGGGTVYYPTATDGPYGLIAVAPGFTEKQSVNSWWGKRLASHGFVVVTIDTKSTLDQPESRGKQLMAALTQVSGLSKTLNSPFKGKIDDTRMAVMGHSMGGGGTLAAARDNPSLKAAIPLAPWHTLKDFSKVTVPTMIIACESDFIAPIDTHAERFYTGLSSTLSRGYLELSKANHFCTNTSSSDAQKKETGKFGVAWIKRFVDGDTRFTPFINAPYTSATVSEYRVGGF